MEKIELWLARDKDGVLCIFCEKPVKHRCVWGKSGDEILNTQDQGLYPEITWEDEEPRKAVLMLEGRDERVSSVQ